MNTPESREAVIAGLLDERAAAAHAREQAARATIAAIQAAREASTADDEHDPEGETLSVQWTQASAIARSAREEIAAIDLARTRVVDGRHGVCERCGRDIPLGRLEALAFTRRCVDCAA